ncbi:hypothetical protein MMC07_009269 [Pseudocyphellaria aurata]|nr:hypothetical protein [Pseudocyphellaria aurata]
MCDNMNVKHALGEQLMDLREAKATIRERLLATEASLVESRQHVTALESKEQCHLRRISELETGFLRLQSKESEMSQLGLQYQEAQKCNQSLQDQLTKSREDASGMSKSLEQKIDEIMSLTVSLSEVQSQLEEAHEKTATFADQKVQYESQATEQRDKMRKQLNQAASLQLEGIESKYLNQLKQLRQEKTATDARVEQLQVEVESSDQMRVVAEAKLEQVKLQLERLQTGIASTPSHSSRNAFRDPAAASPKDHPGAQSRGSQSRGRQDPLWHPVRSLPRPSQQDRPDPSLVKRAADPHGDGMASKRPRKLVSQGLGPVIPDSQSRPQSPNGASMASSRNVRRLSKVVSKKAPKKDKFERRFSQELEID